MRTFWEVRHRWKEIVGRRDKTYLKDDKSADKRTINKSKYRLQLRTIHIRPIFREIYRPKNVKIITKLLSK